MWYPPCIKGHAKCFKIMLRNQYPKTSIKHWEYHENDMNGGSWGVPHIHIYIYIVDVYSSTSKIQPKLIHPYMAGFIIFMRNHFHDRWKDRY